MKNSSNSKKTKLHFLVVIIVFFAISAVYFFVRYNNNRIANEKTQETTVSAPESINLKPATQEDKQEVEANKTVDPKTEQPSNAETVTSSKRVEISSVSIDSEKNVVVQTKLYGTGWQTCSLTMRQATKQASETVDTLYQADFSTCLGFSVPFEKLGSSGEWTIDLSAKNSDALDYNAESTNVGL